MAANDNKTVRVSTKTTISIGINEFGMPSIVIETSAPYKQVLEDARELYLEILDYVPATIEDDDGEDEEEANR